MVTITIRLAFIFHISGCAVSKSNEKLAIIKLKQGERDRVGIQGIGSCCPFCVGGADDHKSLVARGWTRHRFSLDRKERERWRTPSQIHNSGLAVKEEEEEEGAVVVVVSASSQPRLSSWSF